MDDVLQCVACVAAVAIKATRRAGWRVRTEIGPLCAKCFAERYRNIVYEYGCSDPRFGGYDGIEEATRQIYRSVALWNRFAEIDRIARRAYESIVTRQEDVDPLTYFAEAVGELRNQITARRRTDEPKGADVSALLQPTAQHKETRRDLDAAGKLSGLEERAFRKGLIDQINGTKAAYLKQALHESGLYRCNAGAVWASYCVSSRKAITEGKSLQFHQLRGEGRVTVYWSYGLNLPDAYGKDTLINIAPNKLTTHPRDRRTLVKIRVNSIKRKPVWLTLPVVFHRPLPPESQLRSVSAIRSIVAGKERWKVCFTLRVARKTTTPKHGRIAVNVGWRKFPEGLRVAYWLNDSGERGELILRDVAGFQKLDDLRLIMMKNFKAIIEEIKSWKDYSNQAEWPPELKESFAGVHLWRRPDKLIEAMHVWKSHRLKGDDGVYDAVQEWYYGTKLRKSASHGHLHLYLWEANQRDQLLRKRREEYRLFASSLKGYEEVILHELDLRSIAERTRRNGSTVMAAASAYRHMAAVGTLRQAIQNVCEREGVRLVNAASRSITQRCASCGHLEDFDAARHIVHKCSVCHAVWDQDYNAALNLLSLVTSAQ